MRRSRFTEEQILEILKEGEAQGRSTSSSGSTGSPSTPWKGKDGGMGVNEARRLRCSEDENRRLKRVVLDLTLDNKALKTVWSQER